MTKFSNMIFDSKDIVKLIGFIAFVGSMWIDLKTDQVKAEEQRAFLQYQIDELKMVTEFVKPNEIKIQPKRK